MLLFATAAAFADEHVVRLSSIAPDGTAYARELRALAADTQSATHGRVRIKLYLGAVAGDELQAWERIEKGQLDAVASAAMLCEELAPTLRILRVPGLFRSRDEAAAILSRLSPLAEPELAKRGVRSLGGVMVGPVILFTRQPIHALAELQQHTYWIWDADRVMPPVYPALGLKTLPLPINEAGPAFEQRRHDGFVATPAAALAFQWSALARYYENLPVAYLSGCLVVANRAFDELSLDDQKALQAAAAKTVARLDAVGRDMDAQLLGGIFTRQGLREVPVSSAFRGEFDRAAAVARQALLDHHAIDPAVLKRVEQWLAELRFAHPKR